VNRWLKVLAAVSWFTPGHIGGCMQTSHRRCQRPPGVIGRCGRRIERHLRLSRSDRNQAEAAFGGRQEIDPSQGLFHNFCVVPLVTRLSSKELCASTRPQHLQETLDNTWSADHGQASAPGRGVINAQLKAITLPDEPFDGFRGGYL
jgi:hypothetical protein